MVLVSPVKGMNLLRLTKTSPATAFGCGASSWLADVHARPVGPGVITTNAKSIEAHVIVVCRPAGSHQLNVVRRNISDTVQTLATATAP